MNDLHEWALLVLRVSIAALFLNAAWACGKNAEARKWTESETALLFPRHARFFALAGIGIMGGGGISILLGIYPRIGALALVGFLVLGARIHLIQRARASAMQNQILRDVSNETGQLVSELGVSASLGHYSSALKNFCLAGVCLFIAIAGTGRWTLIDFT